MAKKQPRSVLKVNSRLTPDGDQLPYELAYNDETFEIKDPVKSMKLFDGAVRWRCSIDGRPVEIFNLEDSWWMAKS